MVQSEGEDEDKEYESEENDNEAIDEMRVEAET